MPSSVIDPSGTTRSFFSKLSAPLGGRTGIPRQLDIDAARGIAIVLVVLGHLVAADIPNGNDWVLPFRAIIYRFHMPLFMALSGISFALSLPEFSNWAEVFDYSVSRLKRLAIPYLFFGLLILFGKIAVQRFLHVDNPPTGSADDLLALIVHPNSSAVKFLWFIYVLGIYFIVVPAVLQVTGRRPLLLLGIALICQLTSWPKNFLLSEAAAYLPYFAVGILLWQVREYWERPSLAVGCLAVGIFVVILTLIVPFDLQKWFVGGVSIPAVLAAGQLVPKSWQSRLAWIGQLSLAIYLMNTLAMGIVKALLLKLMPWDGQAFLAFLPLMAIAGIFGPIVIKRLTRTYAPVIDRYI